MDTRLLADDPPARVGFYMNGEDRLAQVPVGVKAFVAQLKAELIFALSAKTAVALMAGGDLLVLCLFVGVNFGMNFDHCYSPSHSDWANGMPRRAVEDKRLTGRPG